MLVDDLLSAAADMTGFRATHQVARIGHIDRSVERRLQVIML